MNSELCARDLMSTDFRSLSPRATLKEAVALLAAPAHQAGGAPAARTLVIIHDDDSIAGVISMFDILKAVTPAFMQESPHLGVAAWEGLFEESVERNAETCVCEVMDQDVETVKEDTRLIRVMLAMVTRHVVRVPVVDGEGKVVGVVRLTDVFREVARKFEKMG